MIKYICVVSVLVFYHICDEMRKHLIMKLFATFMLLKNKKGEQGFCYEYMCEKHYSALTNCGLYEVIEGSEIDPIDVHLNKYKCRSCTLNAAWRK